MLEFHAHASGSGGNFYTATDGHASLGIECGIRFQDIRKALDFSVSSLDGVLISHAHGDHSLAAKDLLRAGVDCYASEETWEQLGVVDHRARVLMPLKQAPVGPWLVLPFEAVHDCIGTLGFMVMGPSGKKLLFLTDTLYSPYRFSDCHLLAIECNHSLALMRENASTGVIGRDRYRRTASTHMSLERLLKMLAANDLSKVEQIYLLHLSGSNSNEVAFKSMVERATGRPVTICAERSLA